MIELFKTVTVESVTSGHPDKVCDQISDAVLDACLTDDPLSRVAIESFGGHNLLVIGGEITTKANVNYEQVARDVYRDIGYTTDLEVITRVVTQSPDIAQGVDEGTGLDLEQGAGDQGIMYGYATDDTEAFLPEPIVKVHALTRGLENLRRSKKIPWLMPDGKAQLTVHEGKVQSVLVSTQHIANTDQNELRESLIRELIIPVIGDISGISVLTNPTGVFSLGGFDADTGLTGRKLMVDTYCGLAPNGGGAFSGKDATKVDRSAAYMARFVAKNLVANGYGGKVMVSAAYAIGRSEPLMVDAVNEKGENLASIVQKHFDFRPRAIIERLNLRRPIFRQTASYGHFGRNEFPWEEIISLS